LIRDEWDMGHISMEIYQDDCFVLYALAGNGRLRYDYSFFNSKFSIMAEGWCRGPVNAFGNPL